MTEPGLPLAGLRVLDISSFIAAPAAAVVLGDWGADVIKVEGPDGDPNRRIMHNSSNYPKGAVNYPWHMDSRNKRSIVLDLKKPDAPRRARPADRHLGRADLQLPAAGARQAQARLRRREAGQSQADLCLAHRLRRDRPRPRPAGLRRHRLLRALGPSRRPALRRRTARRAGAGAGRSRDGHGARLGDPDGTDAAHEDRRRLVGRHVAARQRPVVVRRRRPGRAGRRLPAAPPAARPAALGAGQHLSHLGRSLAAAHHRARGQDVAGRLRHHRPARARERPALRHGRGSPQALGRARHHPERGLRHASDYEHWRKTMAGARHHLRRHQPAAGRARRPAGGGVRRRRRDGDPRDAAHACQSHPSRLRRAAGGAAGAGARPAQRPDPGRGRPVAATRSRPCTRAAPCHERVAAGRARPQRAGRPRRQLVHRRTGRGRRAGRFRRRRDQDRAAGRRRPASQQLSQRQLPAERQELPLAARRPAEALAGARPQERRARGRCSSG